jgi:hypothetical protein
MFSTMVTIDLLRRTRTLTTATVALLCWWGFGNLYELNGALGSLIRGPQPGALVGAFEAGSPFYYFVPASPLALVLAVVLAVRTRHAPPGVARRTRTAAVLVAVAALATAVLVSTVNPQFRTPDGEGLAALTLVWLAGNAVRLVCVGVACHLLLVWRRVEGVASPALSAAGR